MTALLILAALLAYSGHPAIAAVLLAPLAYRIGTRVAVRRAGVRMVRTGARRVVTGRL